MVPAFIHYNGEDYVDMNDYKEDVVIKNADDLVNYLRTDDGNVFREHNTLYKIEEKNTFVFVSKGIDYTKVNSEAEKHHYGVLAQYLGSQKQGAGFDDRHTTTSEDEPGSTSEPALENESASEGKSEAED